MTQPDLKGVCGGSAEQAIGTSRIAGDPPAEGLAGSGAAGDFAQAYVIAHEYGHHIQNVLGIDSQMRRAQQQRPSMANELSVRLELQADCLAGVWGHSTAQRNILESGDVEAGLNAAAAIGDDRIQRMSGRGVHPEKFTHGSSAQRVEWFRRGLESGRIAACDTFGR
jgi:hypothetical protein